MLDRGPAKKVVVYLNEDTRHGHGPLYQAVLDYLFHRKVAGATLIRPHSGFGPHHRIHTSDAEIAEQLPVRVEFIETAERVERLLPTLYDMVTDGVIEVQETTIIKATRSDQTADVSGTQHQIVRSRGKLMRVFFGESDQWEGEPLYDAVVKKLRMMEILGATVYRGILGYGAKGRTHKESFLHLSRDLPVMISVIDTDEKIAAAATAVESMMEDGLIAISETETVRVVRSAVLPDRHEHTNG